MNDKGLQENFKQFFNKISKRILSLILITEELLIILILFFSIYSFLKFEQKEKIYFTISFKYFKENPIIIIALLVFSYLILIFRSLALKNSFHRFNRNLNFLDALHTLSHIDFRRAISPIGIFSSIILLDHQKQFLSGAKIFLYNQLLITLTDWVFYFLILFIISKSPFFLILLTIPISLGLFLKPTKIDFKVFINFLLSEVFRLIVFYLAFVAFGITYNLKPVIYIYIAWDFSSAITPIFYGTGISELIASIVAYFNKIRFQDILLPLFVIRLIITYLPLTVLLILRRHPEEISELSKILKSKSDFKGQVDQQ